MLYGWVARAPIGACRKICSLLPSLLRGGFVTRLRGCGLCFLVVICTLMWFGSRVWLLLSCGSVFAPVFCLLAWEGGLGSCAACLRRWMSQKGFTILQPWFWWHEFVHVRVDLSCLNVDCHIGLAQHNVRQGWRAWVFQHWLRSGRHCFVSLRCPLTRSVLWTLPMSALGSCLLLRLGLGLPSVLVTGLSCPCGEAGFWDHIWSCPCRPSSVPSRPRCPLLARFELGRQRHQSSFGRNWQNPILAFDLSTEDLGY